MDRKTKSMLMSAGLMGLGQLYNKFTLKGLLYLVIEICALFNISKIISIIINAKNEYFDITKWEIINIITQESAKIDLVNLTNLPSLKRAVWGIITLGEQVQVSDGFDIVQGDHSIFLLVEGLVIFIGFVVFVAVYLSNIKDAGKCATHVTAGKKVPGAIEYIRQTWNNRFFALTVAPAFLGLLFFTIIPIIVTVCVAFTNYSSPNHLPPRALVDWVGFKNFTDLFTMQIWNHTMYKVGIWTIIWSVTITFMNYVMGLLLALMVNKKGLVFKGMWRTVFILPYAVPGFISLLVIRLLFNGVGPVNNMLQSFGLDRIPFFTDPNIAKLTVLGVNCWVGAPYFMILLSAAMTNISADLYEAAEIDGGSKLQQFWHITLPMLLFQTAPLIILSFAYNFNNFGAIYLLTDGNPVNSDLKYAGETDIFISWVYKLTLDQKQYGMAGVISILLFIFVASVSLFYFTKTKSFKEEDMI